MIPVSAIEEWRHKVPWQTNEQVEQDLIICRGLTEIFKDEFLAKSLAFRGGTALHKLYLSPQPRYSEDIDLVQISAGPIKPIIDKLRDEVLSFLGVPVVKQKANNNTLIFRLESEIAPVMPIRLKVETNCREHFSVLGWSKFPYSVHSEWYTDSCEITTYPLEELLGTKLRALYQRRKGRDLFDLYTAISTQKDLDLEKVLACYREYMNFVVGSNVPTQKEFLLNMEEKMQDDDFLGDTQLLLRDGEAYDPQEAYKLIKKDIISKL
ncbi:MAG: nucleotidyl transferase AbiEii/AbiGii toxin family protein [Bacteroidales bacterium]|nr:nucleotidyl transferase AbiEii/AbiGii toxin family protein [Bacteroidales bacterium]